MVEESAAPTQLPLVRVPATPKLGVRQQQAWQCVQEHPNGVIALVVGHHLHVLGGKHGLTDLCDYCKRDGQSVLQSKALKPLVTYSNVDGRRIYRARNPQPRERAPEREPTEAELARDPFAGL